MADAVRETQRHDRQLVSDQPDLDRVFHALGDPTRRAMVERLTNGPLTVSQLAAPFDMTLTAVAQHLQLLEEAGLVRTEKVGRVRTCSIGQVGIAAVAQWVADRRSPLERRLDRLGELLEDLPAE